MKRYSLNRKFKNNDLKKKFHRKWSPDEVKRVDQSSVNENHNCQSKSYMTRQHVVRGLLRHRLIATLAVKCHISMVRVKEVPHLRLIATSSKGSRWLPHGRLHVIWCSHWSLPFLVLAAVGQLSENLEKSIFLENFENS